MFSFTKPNNQSLTMEWSAEKVVAIPLVAPVGERCFHACGAFVGVLR